MKKLRLLVTKECNRNCIGCCNKDWNLDNLPVVKSFLDYDEILITGGEPMLFPVELLKLIYQIWGESKAKIFMYTAKTDDTDSLTKVIDALDGITLTLHEQKDIKNFEAFDEQYYEIESRSRTFRLNVFKEVSNYKAKERWQIKDNLTWQKNCPLPKDEVFMRLEDLWIKKE